MPAQLQFENGGESLALLPTRYPGSEASPDGGIALARKTEWESFAPDAYFGLGQRLFATDAGETPMLEVRSIALHHETQTSEAAADGGHA
jgi:type VI secretion system protein ImpE